MPAPVPARISYDDPAVIAALARGAGEAVNRRTMADRSYEMQLRQMANDASLLQGELGRRYDASQIPQTRPSMLSEAAGYADPSHTGQRTFTNETGQDPIPRFTMQDQASAGSTGFMPAMRPVSPSQSARQAPVNLVPASGGYGRDSMAPSAVLRERSTGTTFTQFPEGTRVTTAAGARPEDIQTARQMDPRFAASQTPMVTPEVRQQLDAVRALQGSIPPQQFAALERAVMSGQMTMPQALDDARQMTPNAAGTRLTATDRLFQGAQADAQIVGVLDAASPADRANFAAQRRLFEPEQADPFLDRTPEAQAAVERRNIERGERAYQSWRNLQVQLASAAQAGSPLGVQSDSAAAGGAPAVGEVVDGYEYLGGDPGQQSSWRQR